VRPSEEAVVNKALDLYGKGRLSRAEILKNVTPVVVYLPDMTCVGLNLNEGVLGADTTLCFDEAGKQVVYYVSGA
jgi:hypothetical protein